MKKNTSLLLALSSFSLVLIGCVPLDSSSGGSYGSSGRGYGSQSGYGYSNDRDYYEDRERERLRDERDELEREREKLERDRARLERQREKEREAQSRPPPPPPVESCPSGWHPRNDKCSSSERKKGCKDMRLKNGQLCVYR